MKTKWKLWTKRGVQASIGLVILAAVWLGIGFVKRSDARASGIYDLHLPVLRNGYPRTPNAFGVYLSPFSQSGGLEEIASTSTYWVRGRGISWAEVEPVRGTRNWDALADLEASWLNVINRGLSPMAVVVETPSWAQKVPGFTCGPIAEAYLPDFADFMFELVQRYSGPPFNIKDWEIWNEPEIALGTVSPNSPWGCWGDPGDPYYGGGYYGQMLAAIYPAVKAADPEAQLLVGGLLLDCDPNNPPPGMDCSSSNFLEGILAAGAGSYFDGVSFHAYDFYGGACGRYANTNWSSGWDTTGPVLLAKTAFIRDVLNSYGAGNKILINTEMALLCGSHHDPPGTGVCSSDPSSQFEITKAHYVAQAYASTLAAGLDSSIWYSLKGWRNSGLLYNDLTSRPAFQAYEFSMQQLQDATFLGQDYTYPGVTLMVFDRAAEIVWIAWSQDGNTHGVTLPGQPGAVYDSTGNSVGAATSLVINYEPFYIIWPK